MSKIHVCLFFHLNIYWQNVNYLHSANNYPNEITQNVMSHVKGLYGPLR